MLYNIKKYSIILQSYYNNFIYLSPHNSTVQLSRIMKMGLKGRGRKVQLLSDFIQDAIVKDDLKAGDMASLCCRFISILIKIENLQ